MQTQTATPLVIGREEQRAPAQYSLYARGEHYMLNEKGEIRNVGQLGFSDEWKLLGIARHWRATHYKSWDEIRRELDNGARSVEGYVHDYDHGAHRVWLGRYNGRIPQGRVMKVA